MISVIIPVYNCETYISRCVDSVLNQSYRDFELILVDDGSTDSSGALCDGFLQRDKRVLVIHKKNGGASSARNAGLDLATGEYIAFIDADDWVDANYLDTLIAPTKMNQMIDIIVMPWKKEEEFKNKVSIVKYQEEECNLKKEMACLQLLQIEAWRGWSVHSKLYRATLFQGLRFCQDLPVGEDLIINLELFYRASHVYYIPQSLYHYCYVNNFSLTHKIDVEAWTKFLQMMVDYISARDVKICVTKEMFSEFCRVAAIFYMEWINRLILSGIEEKEKFFRLANTIDGASKLIFTQLPQTPLFSLKAHFYAKPLKVYDNFQEMLRDLRHCGEGLYIYGAGEKAKRVVDFFDRKEITFNSFVVSDGQENKELPDRGHPIIHLSELLLLRKPDDVTIFLALKDLFAEEVLQELSKYTFKRIYYL